MEHYKSDSNLLKEIRRKEEHIEHDIEDEDDDDDDVDNFDSENIEYL